MPEQDKREKRALERAGRKKEEEEARKKRKVDGRSLQELREGVESSSETEMGSAWDGSASENELASLKDTMAALKKKKKLRKTTQTERPIITGAPGSNGQSIEQGTGNAGAGGLKTLDEKELAGMLLLTPFFFANFYPFLLHTCSAW